MNWGKIKESIIWFFKSYIWIVPLVILVDQATKLIIESAYLSYVEEMGTHPEWYIISPKFINIKLSYNLGAAWSILSNHHWLLALISVVASLAITFFLIKKYSSLRLLERICGFLILGGCVGNAIDRLFYPKGVIDFISPGFIDFPTFNIADSALVVGILVFMVLTIIDEIKGKEKDGTQAEGCK